MRSAFLWLSLGLAGVIVWLAVLAWQHRAERDHWRQKVAIATQRLADQRAKRAAAAAVVRRDSGAAAALPGTLAATPKVDPAAPAAADPERARLIAAERGRSSRLNTLSGYDVGFVALRLPPETVARAKAIILAQAQASADARKGLRSLDEAMAAVEPVRRAMDQQLTELLGPDAYEQVQAYQREDHFDWTIGTDMWDGGAPLDADQLHALALAIVRTRFEEPNIVIEPKPHQTPDAVTGLSRQDTELLAASGRFLSARQQDILRQNLIEDNRYNASMRDFAAKQRKLWQGTP